MHDIVISGGTIVDGSGAPAFFSGDIAIDLNLIDFNALRLHRPEIVHDLPAGGRRLVPRVDSYRATLVAGTPTFEGGEETGARPGRLVRATV